MIAVDTNILVYAHRQDAPLHGAALAVVRALAEGDEPWAIPAPCVHEFFSIATHPRIYRPPSTTNQALEQIRAWRESPTLALLSEDDEYWVEFDSLVSAAALSGPVLHDARIAALCLRHGARLLYTADRDFSRFPRLAVKNPLA